MIINFEPSWLGKIQSCRNKSKSYEQDREAGKHKSQIVNKRRVTLVCGAVRQLTQSLQRILPCPALQKPQKMKSL